MAKWSDYVLAFLPSGLTILAGELKNRDKNDTGADDAWGKVVSELAPIAPLLLESSPNDNATDKAMAAILRTSYQWLKGRKKLPPDLFPSNSDSTSS